MDDTKALVAEFIGTFALIFIGAGVGALGAGGIIGVALAHGFVVVGLAYAFGHISGTHINPAVTISLLVGKQIDAAKAGMYIVAQLLGGIVGAAVLAFVLPESVTGLGQTVPAEGVGIVQTFIIEMLLTFFLVNTIYNTAISGKAGNFAPIAIGLTLIFCILMGGSLTGASLNPARTLGPAIFSWDFTAIWVYFIACPLGGALAALLYGFFAAD